MKDHHEKASPILCGSNAKTLSSNLDFEVLQCRQNKRQIDTQTFNVEKQIRAKDEHIQLDNIYERNNSLIQSISMIAQIPLSTQLSNDEDIYVKKKYRVPLHLRKPFNIKKYNRRSMRGPEAANQFRNTFSYTNTTFDRKERSTLVKDNSKKKVLIYSQQKEKLWEKLKQANHQLSVLNSRCENGSDKVEQLKRVLQGCKTEDRQISSMRTKVKPIISKLLDDDVKLANKELQDLESYKSSLKYIEQRLKREHALFNDVINVYNEALNVQKTLLKESRKELSEIKVTSKVELERLATVQKLCSQKSGSLKQKLNAKQSSLREAIQLKAELDLMEYNKNLMPIPKESTENITKNESKFSQRFHCVLKQTHKDDIIKNKSYKTSFHKIKLITGLSEESKIIERYLKQKDYLKEFERAVEDLQLRLEHQCTERKLKIEMLHNIKYNEGEVGDSREDLHDDKLNQSIGLNTHPMSIAKEELHKVSAIFVRARALFNDTILNVEGMKTRLSRINETFPKFEKSKNMKTTSDQSPNASNDIQVLANQMFENLRYTQLRVNDTMQWLQKNLFDAQINKEKRKSLCMYQIDYLR